MTTDYDDEKAALLAQDFNRGDTAAAAQALRGNAPLAAMLVHTLIKQGKGGGVCAVLNDGMGGDGRESDAEEAGYILEDWKAGLYDAVAKQLYQRPRMTVLACQALLASFGYKSNAVLDLYNRLSEYADSQRGPTEPEETPAPRNPEDPAMD